MEETYCIVDKRKTPCVEPSGYQRDKRGRLQFYCKCAVCGRKKVKYVKENGQVGKGKKLEEEKKVKGGDVFDTVVGTAADAFVHHGLPWMAKTSVEMGRYGASELMRNKNLQKKSCELWKQQTYPTNSRLCWDSIRPIINKSKT